jgi:4-amino-4-deoxy-L-arabinose transferase-like glycosyltransferase
VTTTVVAPPAAATAITPNHSRAHRESPWRQRAALAVLLVATAAMYLWNITIDGMGNRFYAGAAWAGSQNWEALLFGSLDPHNVITVDKPPVSQWVMGLSGQLFGFSSASMLIPQALMAVAAVALLYGAVHRIAGPRAALLAGAALALTPVAALMFRYNNPDAVMVLLMTAAAYCTVRALQRAGATWIALAGVALGFAFLAKMLEGLMVMPAIALVYLIVAPTGLRRRLAHLLGALVAFIASAGWFVALTLLWPASSRPYIAGSTDNNFMNLVLGYNGFARVLGRNHPGGRGEFGGFGNQARGLPRLFTGEFGFEIGWLLPAALLAVVPVLISRRGAPRTDLTRAAAILFGGWLLVDGLVLGFMQGMPHPYYCLSLAPAVAAMFAIGVHEMWRNRASLLHRIGLAAMLLITGGWSAAILGRDPHSLPALRYTIPALTVIAVAALLWGLSKNRRRLAAAALVLAVTGGLAGSAAYAIATIGRSHDGGGASVGPATAEHGGGGGFGSDTDNPQLDAMLAATHTEWSAAINRSSAAAGLELSTHTAVMAIGGFTGADPVPTLSQFQADVAAHRIGYYIAPDNNGHGPGFGANSHTDITNWVAANFTSTKVGSDTVYNLDAPITAATG